MNESIAKIRADKQGILAKAEEALALLKDGGEATAAQARQTERLIEKLRDDDITVAVIGQFKRGKSTLSNRILGDDIMPVGIVPITSAVTKVKYGPRSAEVHFENGVVEPVDFDDLPEYISEQKNENNKLGVRDVILHTPSPFLENGLTYVDTPGVGSFHRNNTETAYEHMKEADAVIFLLSVDSPINQIEIDFLYNTREYAGKFYFAVNKIDVVSEKDLGEYCAYCRKLLQELMETENIQLYPVSSATGQGVEELKNAILADCETSIREIMRESTRKKLKDTVHAALRQLDFYWSAMTRSYEDLDERFAQIDREIEALRKKAEGYEAIFEIRLNELKLALTAKVYEIFGIEYTFEIEEMPLSGAFMKKEEYLQRVDALCSELQGTLRTILMYREENAYTVVRRIEDINKVTRKLRSVENWLDRQ